MLMHPFMNIPYKPSLLNLLGGIEIYDREDTLGKQLWNYQPNSDLERDQIIRLFVIPALEYLTYRHKFVMINTLKNALTDKFYDFKALFETDFDDPRCIAWDESEIDDPRGFFERILSISEELWAEDLRKASCENPSEW